MQRYIVIAIMAGFNSGILELAPEQASSRSHALASLGEGLFEIREPVQFKRGEIVGYDGDVNKALLQLIEPVESEITSSGLTWTGGDVNLALAGQLTPPSIPIKPTRRGR